MARRLNTRVLVPLLIFAGIPLAILAFIFVVAPSSWVAGGDPARYVEEAKKHMETGDWVSAWVAIRSAVKGGAGKKPEVQFLLGQIAMQQKPEAIQPALQAYRQAVNLKPDYVEAQRELAQLYLRLHYWKEARAEIDRLIQMDPSDGKAYLWAAYVEGAAAETEPIQSKRTPYYETVVERCRTGIQKDPHLLELYPRMAMAYERLSQPEKVAEILDLAIKNNPNVAEAYILKAGRFLVMGKLDDANKVLQQGIEKCGENARIYVMMADVALRQRKPDQSRELLAKALVFDPKNETAYGRLASMYRSDGDREKALATLTQGLAQLPESKAIQFDLAEVCMDMGNTARADQLIDAMAKQTPDPDKAKAARDEAPVFYLRGRRALLNMQIRQAITYLEQARDKQATPQVRLLLARAYLIADELGAAQRELDAIQREQKDPATTALAKRSLAEVQYRLHDFEGAVRSARDVLAINPDDTTMRLLLAQSLVFRNRPAEALREAQTAADRDKENPEPFLLMADIYREQKRPADAEAMFRRALAVGKNSMRVAQRYVAYLRDGKQEDKIKAFEAEARKTLSEEEIIELTGSVEEIERLLKARTEKDDAPASTWIALARLYQYTERTDQAKDALRKALAKAGVNSRDWLQAWQQLFTLELGTDAYDKAAALIDQLKKADPQATELLFADALLALSQNKPDEAVAQLRNVTLSNKTLSQAHFILGQVLARQRKLEEAVAEITKTLELRPQLVPARMLLARIYLSQGNYTAVLSEANEALKFDPRYVPALDLKATAHAGLGAWDQAAAAREEIAKIVPNYVNNLIALAALAVQRHDPSKAEETFRRAYALEPDNLVLVRGMAEFYANTNRAAQGERLLDDYIARHKDQPDAYGARGEFAARTAGPAEAEKYYRKAAELAPNDPYPLLALADRYGQVGEWAKAEAIYRQAIERAPKDTAAKRRLADIFMLQGKLPEAKAAIDEILGANSKDAGALVIAGRIASRMEKPDDARRFMEAALAVDPNYGEAKYRLAELYAGPTPEKALDLLASIEPTDAAFEKAMLLRSDINTRRVLLSEAVYDLRRLLDFRPNSVPGRLALASKYVAMRAPEKAEELFKQLSREHLDQDPALLAAVADAQMFQQHYAEALANYEKALTLKQEFPEALSGEARCLVAMSRSTEAIDRVRKVMDVLPNEVWPRVALVTIYVRTNQSEKAFEAIRTGLVRRPDWEQGYVLLADLLIQDKKMDEARQALSVGLSNLPKSVSLRSAMATIEVNTGRSDAARKILQSLAEEFLSLYGESPEKIDKLRPYMPSVRVYSLALYNLGQTDEALAWGMRLWALDPTDVANANNMAWILATAYKDYSRATEMIRRCLLLLPNHPQVLDTAGWIAFLSGKYTEAADNLLASIKYADNAEAHYHLGRVYEARDRPDEARTEYQKAVGLGLEGKDLEDAQKRLKQPHR
jgi:tetratricopeptide (TPR) repeat protein